MSNENEDEIVYFGDFSSKIKWGDVVFTEEVEGDVIFREENDLERGSCCPFVDFEMDEDIVYSKILAVFQDNYSSIVKNKDLSSECAFNVLKNTSYCMLKMGISEINDNKKMNLLHFFLKFRHDFLALKASKILKIDQEKTDKSFNEVFGIDSKRTPDFIVKAEGNYYIIEITAVTDVERGALAKGDLEYGYKSKYDLEIKELEKLGFKIDYEVLIFDVKDESNDDFKDKIKQILIKMNMEKPNDISLNDLNFYRKEFCNITKELNEIYGEYYGNLFEEKFELIEYHSENTVNELFMSGGKPFTGFYKNVGVSSNIYESVRRNLPRIENKIHNLYKMKENKNVKWSLNYDLNKSNFYFSNKKKKSDSKSLILSDWFDYVDKKRIDLICINLNTVSAGVETSTPKSDFEYFNYVKGSKKNFLNFVFKDTENKHKESFSPQTKNVEYLDFTEKITDKALKNMCSKYEDEDYEEKILKSLEISLGEKGELSNLIKKPFSDCEMGEELLEKAVEVFKKEYVKVNTDEAIIKHSKQPFLLPLYKISPESYGDIKTKPFKLNFLSEKSLGPYTDRVINIINNEKFEFGTKKDDKEIISKERKELADLQRKINDDLKNKFKKSDRSSYFKLKDLENFDYYKSELSRLNKDIREKYKNNKNVLCLVRLPNKNKDIKREFQEEMDHFKPKKSGKIYKGVALEPDFDQISNSLMLLNEQMLAPSGVENQDDFIDTYVDDDIKLLKDMKENSMEKYKKFFEWIKGSNFYHTCEFTSRFCHTLLYHSQTSINSDYVSVDNLGYSDVLILIKGGKKIFPTKRSKLFRMIIPTYESCLDLYKISNLPSSFTFYENEGVTYLVTPWMNLHETILCDGLTTLHRNIGFLCLNSEHSETNEENFNNCFFNLILFFHNRRQTETFLHNMRYLMMNSMSDFSAIDEILPEMAGFNYDSFQYYVRECVVRKFKDFSKKLKIYHDKSKSIKIADSLKKRELLNMFTNRPIIDLNQLSTSVYITYMMSKAPTTQTLEQVSNLKSMMETHEDFLKIKTNINDGKIYKSIDHHDGHIDKVKPLSDYYNELMENDFNFDPKYCVLLGKFMGDYLAGLIGEGEMYKKWSKVLSKSWDEFSNTKGLRGENNEEFFGEKGYYVVYKKILDENPDFISELEELLKLDSGDKLLQKKLKKMNETYRDRVKKENLETTIFHVVDKKQRSGKREIYVMDRKTKIYQQLIENYIGEICKKIPNEVISVPSNKRLSTIHSKVFENQSTDKENYYMVMDCRKWAPKSVVQKFILFISGMRKILPSTFIKHCYNFFDLLTDKRVYTKPHIIDIFGKNEELKMYNKHFENDEERRGVFYKMNYSWMMGIFNYFSSFMHVANQMHISHICRLHFDRVLNEEIRLNMIAHSDDSAGKVSTESKKSMKRLLLIYEILMKSANHLISKKKSNCGKSYYEFISILYIDGKLLSLVVKFAGMFNFHPTDKGYSADINEAYSKCIELILNGSTFSQSYIGFKIQSHLIRRFYFNRFSEKIMYRLPPKMMGIPDAHPLMILLCGSESDILRIKLTSTDEEMKTIYFLNEEFSTGESQVEGFLKSFDCTPNVRLKKDLKNLRDKFDLKLFEDDWMMKNVKFNNTFMNTLQFLFKLKDKTFVASLQDESLTRRISRAYFYRNNQVLNTKYGPLKYKFFSEIINIFLYKIRGMDFNITKENEQVVSSLNNVLETSYKNFDIFKTENLFKCLFSEPLKLCNYMKNVKFKIENVKPLQKTTKPLHIKILNTTEKLPFKIQTQSLSSWIKFPNERHLLPDTRNMHTVEKVFKDFLSTFNLNVKELSVEEINGLLMRMEKKNETEYFCYSNVPSHMRDINTYQDVLNYLAHNTFKNKYIEGLTMKFGKTISVVTQNVVNCLSGDDVDWSVSFCTLISILCKNKDFINFKRLELKTPSFLGGKNMLSEEIFEKLESYWKINMDVYKYINFEILKARSLCLFEKIDTEKMNEVYFHSFLKTQYLYKNSWMGVGQLYINLSEVKINLTLKNNKIIKIVSNLFNYHFLSGEIDYINLCLKNSQMNFLSENMRFIDPEEKAQYFLGIDENFYHKISVGSELIKGIPLEVDYNVKTFLSNPKTGILTCNDRGKMRWIKKEEHFEYNYKIETIPIEIFDSIKLLDGLMPNTFRNKMILKNLDSNFKKDLLDYCVKKTHIELEINKEDIINSHRSTELYRILNFCKKNDLCKVAPKEIRKKDFPAQEGGFLNILVNYSERNKNFDFDWDKIMSPAYIRMKSTQPEAFMAMLIKNVEKNYNDLYDNEDKSIILRNLINVSKISDDNFDEKLLEILCNWSYAGVIGSLSTLKKEIKAENFKSVRIFKKDFPFISIFENLLKKLFKAMINSTIEHLNKIGEIFSFLPGWEHVVINNRNYKSVFSSLVHVNVLARYGGKNIPPSQFEWGDLIVYTIMNGIFTSSDCIKIFKTELEGDPILSNLPVEIDFLNEWFIIYNSSRTIYRKMQMGGFIDVRKRVERLENLPTPFIITRDFLSELGILVKPKNLIHHGVFESEFLTHFQEKKFGRLDKQILRVDFKIVDLNNIKKVSFNQKFFPPYKITEDFLESEEWEEIETELLSAEPDVDYIMENIENSEIEVYEMNPSKRIKAVYKGKVVNVLSFEVSVIFDLVPSKKSVLDRIRQSGQHVVIISDRLFSLDPEFYKDTKSTIYKMKDDFWGERRSFVRKTDFIITVFSHFTNGDFWSEIFNAKQIKEDSLISLTQIPIGIYYNDVGLKEDNSKTFNLTGIEAMENFQKNYDEEKRIEELAKNEDLIINEIKEKMDELIKKGYDKNFLEKYVIYVEEKNTGWEKMSEYLNEILKNEKIFEKLIGKIEIKTEEIIKRNKDPKIYENLFQIPKMLGIGREKTTSQKNISLKEPNLIAEIESIFPGFSSKILSDTLKITEKMRKRFERRSRNLKKLTQMLKINKEGKSFALNFIMLVVNDAQTEISAENENDDVWLDVMDWIDKKFDEETESNEDENENIGLGEDSNSTLNYKPKNFNLKFFDF